MFLKKKKKKIVEGKVAIKQELEVFMVKEVAVVKKRGVKWEIEIVGKKWRRERGMIMVVVLTVTSSILVCISQTTLSSLSPFPTITTLSLAPVLLTHCINTTKTTTTTGFLFLSFSLFSAHNARMNTMRERAN